MRQPESKNDSPLTPDQKKSVLTQMLHKLQSPETEQVIVAQLFNDVKTNNSFGYPPLLADMITKLNGPYQLLSSAEEISSYDLIVTTYLKKNVGSVFRESCLVEKEWSHTQIHLLSEKFSISFQLAHSIRFTIFKGKLLWQVYYSHRPVALKHPFPFDISYQTVDMTFTEFAELKSAGKRHQSKYPQLSFVQNGQDVNFSFFKNTRSPMKGLVLDHGNTEICHICVWDVGEYGPLKLHRLGRQHKNDKTSGINQNRPCCGKDYPFELDHIPSKHLLKEMRRIYPVQDAVFQSDRGYVIALSKSLHENISATYQDKAKKRDIESEAINPSSALLTDIGSYFEFFQNYRKMTLKILGAFRYLYRLNVKRFDKFYDPKLDVLFLNAILLFQRTQHDHHNPQPYKNPVQQRGGTLFTNEESTEANRDEVIKNPPNNNFIDRK